jgi:ABC-type dipeptide/oligopeptide/nickel transport system permease component
MKVLFFLSVLFFSLLGMSQSNQFEVQLVISSEQIQCGDQVLAPCFQAKKVTDPYWTMTIEAIENFEFEAGYEYLLDLKVEHIANGQLPPTVRYTALSIVEKTAIE